MRSIIRGTSILLSLAAVQVLSLILVSCIHQPVDQVEPISFVVDNSIHHAVESLPSFTGTNMTERPVAAVIDPDGNQIEFVTNEITLITDNEDELNAFIERWNGAVIAEIDPLKFGLENKPHEYVLRIDVDSADVAQLEENLRQVGAEGGGVHRVSSFQGLKLLTVATSEAAQGHKIAVSWIIQNHQFQDGKSLEQPLPTDPDSEPCMTPSWPCISRTDGSFRTGYTPNVFDWPSFNSGDDPDIGVVDAWRMMERSGFLRTGSVKIAILDGGFRPDEDLKPVGYLLPFWIADAGFHNVNPITACSWGRCTGTSNDFHGHTVTSVCMAVPDNNFGTAGPAGPVADPRLIYTDYTRVGVLLGLQTALDFGVKIVNMSFGSPNWHVITWFKNYGKDFDDYTRGMRELGVLLFSSAGNRGMDLGGHWHAWPCENEGVICVGGLEWASYLVHPDSDHGGSVDIYAPYWHLIGPDPSNQNIRFREGTSLASPFVAGVAALIWASNPELSADEVEDILLENATRSGGILVVNARNSVREALISGGIPPVSLSITNPRPGEVIHRGIESQPLSYSDWGAGYLITHVRWESDVEGVLGRGQNIGHRFTTSGNQVITATATGSDGTTLTDSVSILVQDSLPIVEISNPLPGSRFFANEPIFLLGNTIDVNERTWPRLNNVSWHVNGSSTPIATAHEEMLPPGTFEPGEYDIIFSAGQAPLRADTSVTITVEDDTGVSPRPIAEILSPRPGFSILASDTDPATGEVVAHVRLEGRAMDHEGKDLIGAVFEWRTRIDDGSTHLLGTGNSIEVPLLLQTPRVITRHTITLVVIDQDGNRSAPVGIRGDVHGIN